MDPSVQKLQVAQNLIQQLLVLVPSSARPQAQAALDAATAQLKTIEAQAPLPPLVAPVFVPKAA